MDLFYSASQARLRADLGGNDLRGFTFRSFSLRQIVGAGILMALLGFALIAYLFAWPAKERVADLQKEQAYWVALLAAPPLVAQTELPMVEQLPDIIEKCGDFLRQSQVGVSSFNVERFSEKELTSDVNLDYALLRLHLAGDWTSIENGLEQLEKSTLAVVVEEVRLNSLGGEALLRIYFRT